MAATSKPRTITAGAVRAGIAELGADVAAGTGRRDAERSFSHELWSRCAEIGLLRLTVPEELGGLGLGARDAVGLMEDFGRLCPDAGLVFAVNSVLWSCVMPVVWFGDEQQQAELLPGLCDGALIAANAMTEPLTGSDAFAVGTLARAVADGYALTGEKTLISNAPVADLFLVYARTDDRPGLFGISVFLVPADAPGVVRGAPMPTMGLRTAPMGSLRFEDCPVARTQVLGGLGAGAAVFSRAMTWERGCLPATAVGVMERQIERCTRRACERRQFGTPIGANQAISHRLADMRVEADASRLLVERWADAQDAGRDATMLASEAKLFATESLIRSSTRALEIFGGHGYIEGDPAEREMRDALAGRIYGGTSEIQRNLIARGLGLP
ncbi:MAG TPA: acyl-CoA dehydrogenase family protein [Thermoleophilaceae bacterium]